MQSLSNCQWQFSQNLKQSILNFVRKHKGHRVAKVILRKKNRVGGIRLPVFRLYHKATVIKTVWHQHKNRNTDHWSMIESPELSPRTYVQLIHDKRGKNAQ